jgi:catechol 2,3-dioxygenase-like lactoylglutathione lyase family enzyme
MHIKFQSPVLISNDIEKLKNFYLNVLGQEIELDFGNCIVLKCGLSLWQLQPDFPITKHLQYRYHNSGNKNLELCFETDEFENVIEELRKFELILLHDVTEEKWGQFTIRFYDPDNNLIEIGETLPCLVRRLSESGLTSNEIIKKTGLPDNKVKEYLDQVQK